LNPNRAKAKKLSPDERKE
jgi:hypothetical protein